MKVIVATNRPMTLEEEATQFLREKGFTANGAPKGVRGNGGSIRAINTGIGGAPRKYGQRFAPMSR